MIETIFSLDGEEMTPDTPAEGGTEGGTDTPAGEPESRLQDDEEETAPEKSE